MNISESDLDNVNDGFQAQIEEDGDSITRLSRLYTSGNNRAYVSTFTVQSL